VVDAPGICRGCALLLHPSGSGYADVGWYEDAQILRRFRSLIHWFWNQIHRYTFGDFLGTNAHLLLDVTIARRGAVFGRQTKFQSEKLMADVYLGIMIAGVNTLIVLGAAFAFAVI
jgi:hypothetical protein